jgi:uncharacterized membrane protein
MNDIGFLVIMIPAIFFTYIYLISADITGGSKFFYGFRVHGLVLNKEDKQKIMKPFKRCVRVSFLIFIILILIGICTLKNNFEPFMRTIFMTYAIFADALLFITYSKAKKLIKELDGKEESAYEEELPKRTVTLDTRLLNAKIKIQSKFRLIFLILLFISASAIVYLAINYNNLPNFIPTDFSGDSTPTDFVPKNFKTVFGLEIAGFIMISLLEFITMIFIGDVSYIKKDKLENSRGKILKYINNIGYSFVGIALCIEFATTITPIILFNQYNLPGYKIILVLLIIMGSLLNLAYSHIMLSSFKVKEKIDYSSDDSKWLLGYFYFNIEDPILVVKRRLGPGYTINLAHKKVKALIALILLFFIINIML